MKNIFVEPKGLPEPPARATSEGARSSATPKAGPGSFDRALTREIRAKEGAPKDEKRAADDDKDDESAVGEQAPLAAPVAPTPPPVTTPMLAFAVALADAPSATLSEVSDAPAITEDAGDVDVSFAAAPMGTFAQASARTSARDAALVVPTPAAAEGESATASRPHANHDAPEAGAIPVASSGDEVPVSAPPTQASAGARSAPIALKNRDGGSKGAASAAVDVTSGGAPDASRAASARTTMTGAGRETNEDPERPPRAAADISTSPSTGDAARASADALPAPALLEVPTAGERRPTHATTPRADDAASVGAAGLDFKEIDGARAERQRSAIAAVSRLTLRSGVEATVDVPELGRVAVRSHGAADNLAVHICAENSATAELLAAATAQISRDVQDAALPVTSVAVEDWKSRAETSSSGGGGGGASRENAPAARSAEAMATVPDAASLLRRRVRFVL